MSKYFYLLSITLSTFGIAAVLIISCERPGRTNSDKTCKACHNDNTELLARQIQAGNSQHLMGTASERSSATCSACHTHEGYLDRMASGEMTASDDIPNPTPPDCRTCHMIHEAYDNTDWDLRYTDPVCLWINDHTVDYGNGNQCANCHQPMQISPYPEVGGTDLSITNMRWGPHHGPQSALVWGTSAYEIPGDMDYPAEGSGKHAEAGCVYCHMVSINEHGNIAGGHTFNLSYNYQGSTVDVVEACTDCHKNAQDFDVNDVVTEFEDLFEDLRSMLVANGWIDVYGNVAASSDDPLVLSPDDAGVLLNFRYMLEDGSSAIHNPAYIMALLKNSIRHLSIQ
jgi:hypothetical protein